MAPSNHIVNPEKARLTRVLPICHRSDDGRQNKRFIVYLKGKEVIPMFDFNDFLTWRLRISLTKLRKTRDEIRLKFTMVFAD